MTLGSFGAGMFMRLLSNLILTRLLFPEAFGLMALVQVFMTGLAMFSDIGIKTSIIRSGRDDPDFLNTAWTLQIIRGFGLWLMACAMAFPAAYIYDEPELAKLLPVVGLNAVISGFITTNVGTANRELRLGRQTLIDLSTQLFGIVLMVGLAYVFRSVWALVIGGMIAHLVNVILLNNFVPGIRNRLRLQRSAIGELFTFGKYIFLSTLSGFLITQGDRAILGGFITTAELGIYNIAFFLGRMPLVLTRSLNNKIILPIYRMKPPNESAANRAKVVKTRRMVVASMVFLTVPLAFCGIWIIEFLYDPRYHAAGAMLVLFSFSVVPLIVFSAYGSALLAAGDSRRHFILLATGAVLQTLLLISGISQFGVFGAIVAPGLAAMLIIPLRVRFTRQYDANDELADVVLLAAGLGINGIALWLHWDAIANLLA